MKQIFSLFCVLLFLNVTYGRRSPHADFIEEYYMNDGPEAGVYSDNILEDAMLDVPGLITKYGYPVEVHTATTEDGYILEMHRIPYGRDQNNSPDPNKPVVFVMHGLLSSSADWIVTGPEKGLGYILADAGYDVWLGNARGNFYSRKHVTLDPDDRSSPEFWNFSWEQIGRFDLPTMIDYALIVANKPRLHYIGHSQGTTVFWVMGSMRPEYNDKIITMHAFAPVAFFKSNQHQLIKIFAPHANVLGALMSRVGINEFLPNTQLTTTLARIFCSDEALTQPICKNVVFIAAGRSEDMLNGTLLPLKMAHTPAGASSRQLVHYGQHFNESFFRRYDHGILNNWRIYNRMTPPEYPLDKVTARVFLHYVDDDVFAHLDDVELLWRNLGWPIAKIRVPYATFSHLDFAWGIEAKSLVYDRTIELMKSFDNL